MTSSFGHMLATGVVILHVAFVIFVVIGGVLALRWPKVVYMHLPAVAWAIYVEWSGAICPLTPLENRLRAAAGLEAYAGDFVAKYVFPVLYPDGLTRSAQMAIGAAVLLVNACLYGALRRRRRSNTFAS
jgi:Protein of Unknown function (DUF2784)